MYGCRPFNFSQICVKEVVNGYEISIAFDDSCRNMGNLVRGDIRVYCGKKDVTEMIHFGTIVANIENIIMVNTWCKENQIKLPFY